MPNHVLPSDVARIALRLYEGLGTPLSRSIAAMLKAGDWDGISEVSPDPRSYSDAKSYLLDAQAASLLRKLQELPTSHDRRGNAIAKWREGETSCYRANERLSKFLPEFRRNFNLSPEDERIQHFFADVRKEVRRLIGRAPPELLEGRFGPGATFSVKGGFTTVPDKIDSVPSLTRGAIWFLPQWLGTQWGASRPTTTGKFQFVPGNRFATVPKTAKTDRAIAAEPCINVFYQLALGRAMRMRLSKAHWDLDRAPRLHGLVAQSSSVTREFATLDLSNASDTVCKNLVKILVPHLWFEALDGLRSPKTLIDGKWHVLEKFSSMGNGFTFELETVLFAALCSVACRKAGYKGVLGNDVYVFGDDIIVPSGAVRLVKSVLEFCGFGLNESKSFFDDVPFRESCGQDFFNGVPVRPYFLKELPNGPQDYVAFANGLRAFGDKAAHFGLDCHRRAWFSVLDCIPTGVRNCRGPKALGDIVIHDEEEHWTVRWRNSIRYLRTIKPARRRRVNVHAFNDAVILASATYGVSSSHPKGWAWHRLGGVVPRDGVLSHKVGWTAHS